MEKKKNKNGYWHMRDVVNQQTVQCEHLNV